MHYWTEIVPGVLFLGLLLLIWIRNELRWRDLEERHRKEMDRMWTEFEMASITRGLRLIRGGKANGELA